MIWQDGGNSAGQYGSLKVFCEVKIWLSITMVATTSSLTEIRGLTLLFLSAPKDPDAEANIKQHLQSAKTVPPSAVAFMDSDNEPKGHLLILDGRAIDANGRTAACAVSALMSAYYVFALEYHYGVYTNDIWLMCCLVHWTLRVQTQNETWRPVREREVEIWPCWTPMNSEMKTTGEWSDLHPDHISMAHFL